MPPNADEHADKHTLKKKHGRGMIWDFFYHSNTLQLTATHYTTLQHTTATHGNAQQHTATHWNSL